MCSNQLESGMAILCGDSSHIHSCIIHQFKLLTTQCRQATVLGTGYVQDMLS